MPIQPPSSKLATDQCKQTTRCISRHRTSTRIWTTHTFSFSRTNCSGFLAARRQRSSLQQFVDSLSPESASFIFDLTSLRHILCACDFVVAAICIQLTQTSNQPGSFASVLWSSQLTSISLRVEHNGHLPHHTTISARSMKHMLAQLLHIVRGRVHSAVNYTSHSSCIQIDKTELICSGYASITVTRINISTDLDHDKDLTSPHQHLLQPHSSSCLQQLATTAARFHYSSLSAHSSNQLLQLCTSTFSSVHQHQNSSNQLRCVQFGGYKSTITNNKQLLQYS